MGKKERVSSISEDSGKSVLGIKFAPLALPLARRLQTLAIILWAWMILLNGTVTGITLLYLLFCTKYWWISSAYFTWMLVDNKTPDRGARRGWIQRWVQNWSIWRHYCDYFPIKLVKTAELDPSKNYIFGSHPHGVLSSGIFGAFGTNDAKKLEIFKKLRIHNHVLAGNFLFPITREWILGLGGVSSSKQSIMHLMNKEGGGNVSVIVVGGAAESLYTSQEQIPLVLKKRKGFIKIALQTGAQLVPTFSFGEAHVYNVVSTNYPRIYKLQEKLRHYLGFAPVIFLGRGVFQYSMGLLPHRKPLHVVVGKPIAVKKNANPSVGEIEALHAEYVEKLEELYKEYNQQYGDTHVKLQII